MSLREGSALVYQAATTHSFRVSFSDKKKILREH